MLPPSNRLRRSADFAVVVRSGMRARRGVLVLHLTASADVRPSRVGLVVGKTVGNSVTRHRVSRRLRAQLAQRLDRLPTGSDAVVRALPAAADASSVELGRDLDAALNRLTGSLR